MKRIFLVLPLVLLAACGTTTETNGGTTAGATTAGATTAGGTTAGATTAGGTTAGTTTAGTTGLCNTGDATIGYAANAKAVFTSSCVNCHAAASGIAVASSLPLDTDANAQASLTSTGNKAYVDVGSSPIMPIGITLTADQICILDSWITGGYLP